MLDQVNWFCVDNNVAPEKKARTLTLSHEYYVTMVTRYKQFYAVETAEANLTIAQKITFDIKQFRIFVILHIVDSCSILLK